MRHVKGTLEINRFQVSYRIYGEGKDVVCLNGAQQSMAMWSSFLHRFAEKFRITLFDFPHQGKGRVLHGPAAVSLDEEVEILRQVFYTLRIGRAVVCSASWGGVVALQFTARYPQYVDRLILASIGMKPNERMKETILAGTRMKRDNREEMAKVLISGFGGELPAVCKKQIVDQFKSMAPERIQAFSEHGMSVLCSGSLDKIVPLSLVRNPALVLYGENDRILDISDVENLVSALPDGKMRVVRGVGHFLHLQDEKVFDIYEELLRENRPDMAV